jgi:biopolymer transport protein ExbB/TolQ
VGDGLPFWLPRIDKKMALFASIQPPKRKLQKTPSQYFLDNFHITTSGMNYEAPLMLAHRVMGPDRVLFAVDYPFEENEEPVRVMDGAPISDKDKSKINQPNSNNPLGRVLKVHADNPGYDTETLELKLEEQVLRENAKVEGYLWLIKVVSAVAPLMGLLGTVTGMINTFQIITLFGTGDPKMMASGISEALVTTMLGLYAAIPLVLMHAFLHSLSRNITNVLDEQTTGMIAERAELDNASMSDTGAGD